MARNGQHCSRLLLGLDRSGRHWTAARKRDSLQRVLDAKRSDVQRLHGRLGHAIVRWASDSADQAIETLPGALAAAPAVAAASVAATAAPSPPSGGECRAVAADLERTVTIALPVDDDRARELADRLAVLAKRIDTEGANPAVAAAVALACQEAQRLLAQRHHLVDELGRWPAN